VSFFVAMVATIAAIGGGLFGYDTGVISGAILYIKREFPIDDATEGLVVSAVTAGALVAAMVAGVLADRGGRRVTNIAAGVVFAIASLLCSVANVAVSTAANWGANFLVSLTFPTMTARLGTAATLFTYAGFGVLALLFVIARVPETKGKTLEEISRLWR
jgi:MFS family permease